MASINKNSKAKSKVGEIPTQDFSYLTLADTFLSAEKCSNKTLYKTLTNAVISGRLCHAYLLYGDIGIGKKTLARLLAMAALCTSGDNGDNLSLFGEDAKTISRKPCFECNSCKKFLSRNHPDYFEFEEKQAKRSIHIDRIRELKREAYIKPNESDYRIYLIPRAENMTTESFNAFLKILEEPPVHSIFILTTTDKSSVAPTILSRCVPFPMTAFSSEHCLAVLTSLFPDIPNETLAKASIFSSGNMAKAMQIVGDENYSTTEQLTYSILSYLSDFDEYHILNILTTSIKNRLDFIKFLDVFISITRQLLLIINGCIDTDDELFIKLSGKYTTIQITNILSMSLQTRHHLELNANQNLLINWFCSNLSQLYT